MDRPACSQLRTTLQEIKFLKVDFDLELPKIKDTRNTTPALVLEEEMREKIKFIKDALFFARFGHLEWVEVTIGTKSKKEIIRELEEREKSDNPEDKIRISKAAWDILKSPDFTVTNKAEEITLIKFKVKDLGFEERPTIDKIYQKAEELGLELCPPEIGPHLRLNYEEVFKRKQSKGESAHISMKHIADSNGELRIFNVYSEHKTGEQRLYSYWTENEQAWGLEDEFIFVHK